MNIPDKAVDAVLDQYGPFLNGIPPEDIDDGDLAALREEASEILSLAAPFIAAQALRKFGADLVERMTQYQELSVREVYDEANERADDLDPQ